MNPQEKDVKSSKDLEIRSQEVFLDENKTVLLMICWPEIMKLKSVDYASKDRITGNKFIKRMTIDRLRLKFTDININATFIKSY